MSTSIYLISSNKISPEEATIFLTELKAIDINNEKVNGLVTSQDANVWISYLGSTVLDESDEEEVQIWANELNASACTFFELTIGKGEKSMELAINIAKESMTRWNMIVDDLYETVYTEANLKEILDP